MDNPYTTYAAYLTELNRVMKATRFILDGIDIGHENGFNTWVQWTLDVRDRMGTVFFAGNGASASMASHFSADLGKNGGFRTETFTDLSLMTAVGNDISFDNIFSSPLKWKGREGDLLVGISSSGNSKNLLNAIAQAKTMGIKTVAVTGMGADNKMFTAADLGVYAPGTTYGIVESAHASIVHHWVDILVDPSFTLKMRT
jgi:D-sedoheptulose 7-phosphate isomerase